MRDLSTTVHVGPAEGRAVPMTRAQLITRKVSSEQTGDAYSLFEVAVEPKGGSQPHIQHRENECFYVLEGEFEFVIEGASIEASAGSLIYVPKGKLHAFKNVGTATGRILVSQTPGGLHERFIEEAGKLLATCEGASPEAEEPAEVERLFAIGEQYGVEIVSPPR